MADIGAKISIDGAKKFRDDLKNITQQGKTLSAQMGVLAAEFENADNKEEILDKATQNLSQQIANQKKVVDKLSEAVEKSAKEKGEDATETLKLKEQLAKAETKLSSLKGKTAEAALGMKDLSKGEQDVSKEANNASGKVGAMTIALGDLAADAIKEGIKGIADVVKNIAGYFVDATKNAAEFADEMLTLSTQTGISTETLQEYKYAASLLDVDLETITGSMSKLTKLMSNAKDGSGAAADAFAKLGVAVTDDNGNLRSATDVFDDAIAALGNIENETERDATAMELFGKSAQDLNPLIQTSADKMAALRQEAHDVGYVMSSDTLNTMGAVQDGFDRLGLAADSVMMQIGSAIGESALPYLQDFVSALQDLLKTGDVDAFIDRISGTIIDLVNAINKALPKILKAGVKIVEKLLKGIVSALPELAPVVVELIVQLVQFIIDNLPMIVNTAVDLILALADGLAQQAPQLIPAVITCIVTIVEGLVSRVGDIIAAALNLINGLVQGLTSPEAISSIIGSIPTIITSLINGIIENLPQIVDEGVDIITNLGVGLIQAIPELVALIPQVVSAIWNAITKIDWLGLGKQIITSIGNGIGKMATNLWEKVTGAFHDAVEWIKNLGQKALQWGKDMIQGFINGIKEAAGWLWDEVKKIGQGVADFLGFSVPKKGELHYYEEWMPDFMMGLAEGIEDNAWRVQDALKDVSGGMTLSGKTTNVEMGGIAVNVYASPNQDANAIARQVMAVMQNEYNAKKAVFA